MACYLSAVQYVHLVSPGYLPLLHSQALSLSAHFCLTSSLLAIGCLFFIKPMRAVFTVYKTTISQ